MSTKITSGPIWQISLYGISMSGSHRKKFKNLFPPGTIILQIHPLHSSNSRSHTFPSFLHSFILITSLHFNSEKSIHPPHILLLFLLYESQTKKFLPKEYSSAFLYILKMQEVMQPHMQKRLHTKDIKSNNNPKGEPTHDTKPSRIRLDAST